MRLGNRIVLVALVVGAGIGVIAPSAVHATAGGPMTASNGGFTGTSGDDLLVISHDANLLTHNRYAAGDPGFESATDFDSTVAGVQTKPVDNASITFNFGDGDDTLRLVGQFDEDVITLGSFGAGTDTVDASSFSQSAEEGLVMGTGTDLMRYTDIEHVIGSPLADTVQGSNDPNASPLTVAAGGGNDTLWGTQGNDVLDGGSGTNDIHGGSGQDTIAVATPLPTTLQGVDVTGADDTFVVNGSSGNDDLGFVVIPDEHGPRRTVFEQSHADGGYSLPDFASVRLNLGEGDDSLVLDSIAPTIVDGGPGNDDIAIDAHEATASVADDAGGKTVTLPTFLYFANGPQTAHHLAHTETLAIFDETVIATAPGAGGGPHVRTWRADGTPVAGFMAYDPHFTGGVNVALGDLDGDGEDEIITGPGPGGGPHVRVFRADGTDTGVGFMAYDPHFTGGVNVAAIDLDGDGVDEIVTVPAQGGGPHVRIWSGSGELLDEFMADGFGTTGLHVSAGSTLNADGGRNILLSASSGSLVEEFGGTAADLVPYPGFPGGASVSGAEVDAGAPRGLNGYHDEIITGAGPGGGPHVKVFESSISGDNDNYTIISQFMAYDPNFHGGVDVAACNPDGLSDEIVTAPGAGGGPHVRMFNGKTGAAMALGFMAYDPAFTGGVHVACGGAETKAY
jgi:hypothetical protein